MKIRKLLAFFHFTNFLVMFFVTLYIIFSNGSNFESSIIILYIYYLISSLGGVTLAFWLSLEERRLEKYSTKAKILEDKLLTLEEKIKIIQNRFKEKT